MKFTVFGVSLFLECDSTGGQVSDDGLDVNDLEVQYGLAAG